MPKSKTKAKNILTMPNIRRLANSLAEAASNGKKLATKASSEMARKRAREIVRMAGGKIACTGDAPVLVPSTYELFIYKMDNPLDNLLLVALVSFVPHMASTTEHPYDLPYRAIPHKSRYVH
jgi:hypothetical protein